MSHLTESDRLRIEHGLQIRMSFQQIAQELGKSRTTIVREVQKHRAASTKGAPGRISNRCIHRRNCDIWHLCEGRRCQRRCSACAISKMIQLASAGFQTSANLSQTIGLRQLAEDHRHKMCPTVKGLFSLVSIVFHDYFFKFSLRYQIQHLTKKTD